MQESPPTTEQWETLQRYADAVASSPHNLVSRQARTDLMTRHIPESVALATSLPTGRRLLDVGSGGGLPGIVIAVVRPDLDVHLLDSTAKKTAFLEDVAADLQIRATVHTGRAEALTRTALGGSFDLVTARAVAPLAQLLPITMPFLVPDGTLHAIKGERWSEELVGASDAMRRAGAVVIETPTEPRVAAATPSWNESDEVTPPRVLVFRRRP